VQAKLEVYPEPVEGLRDRPASLRAGEAASLPPMHPKRETNPSHRGLRQAYAAGGTDVIEEGETGCQVNPAD